MTSSERKYHTSMSTAMLTYLLLYNVYLAHSEHLNVIFVKDIWVVRLIVYSAPKAENRGVRAIK